MGIAGIGAALTLGCGPGDSGEGDAGSAGSETSGSSSTGANSSTGDPPQPSLLELCAAPEPCEDFGLNPGSNTEEVNAALDCAVSRALESIADGAAVELSSSFCDIGCWGTDLLLVGDGTVYVQQWMTTADTIYESIDRCTVQPASFFEACLGQPPAGDCSNWGAWGTDCAPTDAVQCP
jgi:hypothetical protein